MMAWMDFIMPASRIVKIGITLYFVLLSLAVHADSFDVFYAKVSQRGNGHILNAEIKYSLTPRVIEALDNGVKITFSQQFELIRTTAILGDYWQWTEDVWIAEIRYELRYHALSQQYILDALDTDTQRHFPTLGNALFALGKIRDFNLPPEHLDELENISLQLRSELDIYALPTPMRPGALLSDKWQLTSPWVTAQWD